MSPSYFLVVDTSTERGIIGLFDGSDLKAQVELPFGYQSSNSLMPLIVQLFTEEKIDSKQLSFVATGIGPGSYTGIRVGVVVAKTLAFSCQIPLVGICSLSAFIPQSEGLFASIIDAKIGGVYLQLGEKINETIRFLPAEICPLQELENKLSSVQTIVSPHLAILKPKILELFPHASWRWEEKSPNIRQLGLLAEEKFQHKDYSLDGHLDLLYLRKTQAEIEKQVG